MTVTELINELKQFPAEMEVLFAHSSGDYWRTQLAEEITELEIADVAYSDYHSKYKVNKDGSNEETKEVLILM